MQTKIEVKKVVELIGHQHPIYTLIAAPEPGRFFSAGGDKSVVEWDINDPSTGTLIAQLPYTIYSLCVLPENLARGRQGNQLIVGTSEGGIHIIDLSTKKEIKYFQLPGEGVFNIQYSEVHHIIAASTAKGNLLLIHPGDLSILSTIHLSEEKIRSIAFNPVRPYMYTACSDTNVYVIDIEKKEKVFSFVAHSWACNAICYDAVNNHLITCSKDAHIRIWDIKNHFEMIKNIPAHNYAIYQIAYNPSIKIYATASRDKTLKLWDDELEILVRINKEDFEGHTNSVNTILWLDDQYLVSGGDDRKLMVWEITKQ